MIETDLLVVGAGPTGLYAAYYAGFRGLTVTLMDSLPEPGGQVTALYPEKLIFDVAGLPQVKGQDLVDNLVAQAAQSKPDYILGHRAEKLEQRGDRVRVESDQGLEVLAAAVLITAGIGTFSPREVPVGQEYEGRGLRYFVPKLDELSGLDVLIVGGGDSALDWASSLEPLARSVTLIHRRTRFRAHERSVERLLQSRVRLLTPWELHRVFGEGQIDGVEIINNATQERAALEVQAVVAALGFVADLGPMTRWGLEQRARHIVVDSAMRTNLPRVFAAGDIVDYEGKVKLIATGFGEAATAVNNAVPIIRPGAKVFPGHSSDVG
ncbi:NAD(P)/FAD-dependent oxidoreductase [Actinopolymorpha pittospori]|jgi:thioredoxin reductase